MEWIGEEMSKERKVGSQSNGEDKLGSGCAEGKKREAGRKGLGGSSETL